VTRQLHRFQNNLALETIDGLNPYRFGVDDNIPVTQSIQTTGTIALHFVLVHHLTRLSCKCRKANLIFMHFRFHARKYS